MMKIVLRTGASLCARIQVSNPGPSCCQVLLMRQNCIHFKRKVEIIAKFVCTCFVKYDRQYVIFFVEDVISVEYQPISETAMKEKKFFLHCMIQFK